MKSKFILPAFLFVFGVVGLLAILIRCSFTPIDPIQTESSDVTLRVETSEIITTCTETVISTTSTDESTSTNNNTTTGTTETVGITSTTTETIAESILETKVETSIEITTKETATESSVVKTATSTKASAEISQVHDEFVKTFTNNTYYSSKFGSETCGGSGRKLISCNTTDEIKGSIASRYLYDKYGYNYNGKRTKVYLVVYRHPEMTGYYYVDDACADPTNTLDFFYANTANCPFQYDGLAGDIDCYICNY
jgi:hypothetical protein